MTTFSYRIDAQRQPAVVHLRGEIDLAAVPSLETALAGAEGSEGDVVLDMTEVTFLDSSGLRVILAAQERLAAGSRSLTLSNVSQPVRRVLEITGLDTTLGLP